MYQGEMSRNAFYKTRVYTQ